MKEIFFILGIVNILGGFCREELIFICLLNIFFLNIKIKIFVKILFFRSCDNNYTIFNFFFRIRRN